MRAVRVVRYVLDPLLDWSVPVAALIQTKGSIRVVPAPFIPGPDCLPNPAAAFTIARGVDRLVRNAGRFDELDISMGPYFVLSAPQELPLDVADPEAWVESTMLPHRPADAKTPGRSQLPARPAQGYSFFEQHKVAHYVHKHFTAATHLAKAPTSAEGLPAVSHWVRGGETTLLLEPIVARKSWRDDLQHVNSVLSPYRVVKDELPSVQLIAYVLPGLSEADQSLIEATLHRTVDELVVVERDGERSRFLRTIRKTGQSGGGHLDRVH